MITKRIIPCLDIKNGRVVKGTNFQGLSDVSDPVALAAHYSASGADKVSVNSGAIRNPKLIYEAAQKYGDQCVVLSADIKRVEGQFRVFAKGGREDTGLEAIDWIKRGVAMGAGEIVVNSIDTDGVKGGFDIEMLQAVCDAVNVPVIASGGAGSMAHFVELFKTIPDIDAGLAASVFHFGQIAIPDLKQELRRNDIIVRV